MAQSSPGLLAYFGTLSALTAQIEAMSITIDNAIVSGIARKK